MPFDSQQSRMSAVGAGRPWLRSVRPVASPTSKGWRRNIGLSYSGNCFQSIVDTFVNNSFANQTGTFDATFLATPGASLSDGTINLSDGTGSTQSDYECLIRYDPNSGEVEVRNGGSYAADAVFAYSAGVQISFTVSVNVPAETYTVVADSTTIATDYVFRNAPSVSQLNNWALRTSGSGTPHEVCNFAVVTTVSTSSLFRGSDLGGLSSGGPFFADPLAV